MALEAGKAIHYAALQPAVQKDVEDFMHDWLRDKGFTGGETQVRKLARKVFNLFK